MDKSYGLQSDAVIVQNGRELRRGWTTGSCAAAAAKAAAAILLGGADVAAVRLTTPRGIELWLEVQDLNRTETAVSCAVRKDGGDDPDVTSGLLIYAEVSRSDSFEVDGGEGVGRVTREGLSVPVGMAAINPVPRQMIETALREVCEKYGYAGALRAVISVPGGETIAKRTFNPKLGISGGISILGTSGIVEPMSEHALIDTIHLDISAVRASGATALLLTPGNYGRDFAARLGLESVREVKCSNYLGEAIDFAVYKGFSQILLVAHAGKLVKTAAGLFSTHSRTADARAEVFTAHAALCGADVKTLRTLFDATTADASIEILRGTGLFQTALKSIALKIEENLRSRVEKAGGGATIDFIMFSNKYGELIRSDGVSKAVAVLVNNAE